MENNRAWTGLFCGLVLSLGLMGCGIRYQRLGNLDPALKEISGMVAAHPDTLWVHNDSGDLPRLYRIDSRGKIQDTFTWEERAHIDWEDMTTDPAGKLYIGDLGNNARTRTGFVVYIWQPGQGNPAQISFHYPGQRKDLDAEALCWFRDSLWIFTKAPYGKGSRKSEIYTLPAVAGTFTARYKGSLTLKNRVVTAAAVHPAGDRLALTTYNLKRFVGIPRLPASLVMLYGFEGSHPGQARQKRWRLPPLGISTPFEALDFVGPDEVYLGSEASPINRPFLAKVRFRKWKNMQQAEKK